MKSKRGRNYVPKPFVPFRSYRGIGGREPNSIDNLPKRIARGMFKHRNCPNATVRKPGGAGSDLLMGCSHTYELSWEDIVYLMRNAEYVWKRVEGVVEELERGEKEDDRC